MGYVVLVADDDANFREEFGSFLETFAEVEEVVLVVDGAEALARAEEKVFDVAFVNAMLREVDGCAVGAKLKKEQPTLKLIMISCMCNQETQWLYGEIGCIHCLLKPFRFDSIKELWQMLKDNKASQFRALKKSDQVKNFLIELGCCENLLGFKYMCEGVKVAHEKYRGYYKMSEIYQELAILFETSESNIERNIRYLIEQAWSDVRGKRDTQYKFEENFLNNAYRPTNKHFIAEILKRLA